jgi:hypothetical protein
MHSREINLHRETQMADHLIVVDAVSLSLIENLFAIKY